MPVYTAERTAHAGDVRESVCAGLVSPSLMSERQARTAYLGVRLSSNSNCVKSLQATMPCFTPRARVVFTGLKAREDLNGKEGELLSYIEDAARWATKVVATGECIRVKPANLLLAPGLCERLCDKKQVALVLAQCDGASLRALRATNTSLAAAANAVMASASWRFSTDAAQLAAWHAASPVFGFFTLAPGATKRQLPSIGPLHHAAGCLSRSASGKIIAHAGVDASDTSRRAVHLWDACAGIQLGRVGTRVSGALVLALSPNGCRLAVGGSEGGGGTGLCEIHAVDITGGVASLRLECSLPPSRLPLASMAWSECGERLLCAGSLGTDGISPGEDRASLRLWRIAAATEVASEAVKAALHAEPEEMAMGSGASGGRSYSVVSGRRDCLATVTCGGSSGSGDSSGVGCIFACGCLTHAHVLLVHSSVGAGRTLRTSGLRTSHASGIGGISVLRGGERIVCAGCDSCISLWASTYGSNGEGAAATCLSLLDYRATVRAMPWFESLGKYEREHYDMRAGEEQNAVLTRMVGGACAVPWETEEEESGAQPPPHAPSAERPIPVAAPAPADRVGPSIASHQLLAVDSCGASMLVTADRAGCVCIWDVGSTAAQHNAALAPATTTPPAPPSPPPLEAACVSLVAVMPPPDSEGAAINASAVRGVAITDTGGASVAGNGVLYANARGELTKFVPAGRTSLHGLPDGFPDLSVSEFQM
jgi:hypothetical protein